MGAPKKKKAKRIKIPYLSKLSHWEARLRGKMPPTTLNPSSGGMGRRLKKAKTKFSVINLNKITATKSLPAKARNANPKTVAKTRLEAGPAREISAASARGFFRFQGLNGVGLAQPKRMPAWSKKRIGTMIVPSRSMWTSGLRLILPRCRAVGSPRRLAIQAWADSWTLMEIARAAIASKRVRKISRGFSPIRLNISFKYSGCWQAVLESCRKLKVKTQRSKIQVKMQNLGNL